MRDAFWRESAISRFFEEAFGASEQVNGAGELDVVAITPSGLRLDYSNRSAEWLTEVTQRPQEYQLVFDYLYEVLSIRAHPLGRLCGDLGGLLCTVLETSNSDDGAEFHGGGSSSQGGSQESGHETCRHGVACMKLGISKLLSLVMPQSDSNYRPNDRISTAYLRL